MENRTVWLVQCEHGHELYDSEEKARKRYFEIRKELIEHNPNESNYWDYEENISVDEDDTTYSLFYRTLNGRKEMFVIYYAECRVR
jgi:hypothetical protein